MKRQALTVQIGVPWEAKDVAGPELTGGNNHRRQALQETSQPRNKTHYQVPRSEKQ